MPRDVSSLPDSMKKAFTEVKNQLLKTRIGEGIQNVYASSTAIGVSIATSFLICVLFIVLMSFFSEIFIYVAIFTLWAGLAFATYLFYDLWDAQKGQVALLKSDASTPATSLVEAQKA